MEEQLIRIAKQYVEMKTGPESESISNKLFDLAALISSPRTKAGRAIIAWVKAEEETDFSMSAGDEFEDMYRAISVIQQTNGAASTGQS